MAGAQDTDYLIAKARQCFRLADACTDPTVSFKLRQLGLEFAVNAIDLGADPKVLPSDWFGGPPR
jgi:hypothetical protein